MIYWVLFFTISFSFASNTINALSQDMPDPGIADSQFKRVQKNRSKYLRLEDVKSTLVKHFPEQMKKMNWSEQDLFYKSLLNYSSERLHSRYPFTKGKNISQIKEELNAL